MKIAVAFGPLCLSFRGSFDFTCLRSDPRGLTGSELGFVRIAEELHSRGHQVELFTVADQKEWLGMPIRPWSESGADEYDAAIAINEPDLLRGMRAGVRVCPFWLNDTSFCRVGFDEHVDLFCSPSAAHLRQVLTNPEWHRVEVLPDYPQGKAKLKPRPEQWSVVPLGCDLERYAAPAKVRGRVIHTSSPDRGLHWLLQEWPKIRAAAPWAELRVFYRLREWIDGFANTEYFPPIEPLRARALFIEESIRRFRDLGGLRVTICDSVSREQIEREQLEAAVAAYPCDPVNSFTEGYSVSTAEACAARACPVISDADALGEIYGAHVPTAKRGDWSGWSDLVVRALTDDVWREEQNDKAQAFAATQTWALCASRLERAILDRLSPPEKTEEQIMSEIRIEGRP